MKELCVYIMANAHRTIYTGVTSNLYQRVWQHKHHIADGFTKQQNCTKLVYIAEFGRMADAIAWEKTLKGKSREKKIALIEARNPRWNDLAWDWYDDADCTDVPKERHSERSDESRAKRKRDGSRI